LDLFSSAASQRTAYSEVPSQMSVYQGLAAHCRLGRLLDLNPAGLQSGVATNEPPLLSKIDKVVDVSQKR
jgi:hypothetical protein